MFLLLFSRFKTFLFFGHSKIKVRSCVLCIYAGTPLNCATQTFVVDFLFIVTPIVGVCNCSMFCCTLLYVHSSIAITLMEKIELVALLNLSSWCLVMVERLFLAVPWGCLQFVIGIS